MADEHNLITERCNEIIPEEPMPPDTVYVGKDWISSEELPCLDPVIVDPYIGREVYLSIEGGQRVFYRGAYVTRIRLRNESLLFGRRDVMSGHYPDVDLAMYWKQDRCLSRRHLRIYRDFNCSYIVEDLCNNNATFLNSYDRPLNRERAELKPGDRILVSRSIAIDFCVI